MGNNGLAGALRRGAFHAAVGTAIAVALLTAPRVPAVAGLGAVTAVYLGIDAARLLNPALNRLFKDRFGALMREKETARLTGSSYFLAGALIAALAYPAPVAAAAVLFLSFGDSAATAIGLWKGRVRWHTKSLEGHLACLGVCMLVAAVFWRAGYLPFAAGALGALIATIFEALYLPVNDNLTIPVLSGLAMYGFLALS